LVTLSTDARTCEALFVHIMDIPSKRGEDRARRLWTRVSVGYAERIASSLSPAAR